MEQNFDLLAQSRANYYTKGSPVQFVRVELLKGDVTGEIAVCLSFKNISSDPLAALEIRFKCKDTQGKIVCEDGFYYEQLAAGQGEVFGADEAVFVSPSSVGSVEVELVNAAFANGRQMPLQGFKRARLPAPKVLPTQLARQLEQRTGKQGFSVVPQILPEGWYCACGAFHPSEEDCVWCSECGSDRILLQNTLSSLLQNRQAAQQPVQQDEPTRMVDPIRPQEPTRVMPRPVAAEDEDDMKIVSNHYAAARGARPARAAADDVTATSYFEAPEEYREEPEEVPGDVVAGQIIRWAPPITALLCLLIVAGGLLWYMLH